jgi:general secretion pathway protein E
MSKADLERFEHVIDRPNGLILMTGPTGCGKSTTLYGAMRSLINRKSLNVITIEDPVEYVIDGISQVEVDTNDKVSFHKALRSSLRHDPDVLMIGEIRDEETASVAAQASLTGHLVFSSLHANGSVAAVIRLRDLGLDDYLIAASLRGVIAQRLLRKLCPECRRAAPVTVAEQDYFARADLPVPDQIWHPAGCSACLDIGYSGRVGVFEIVTINDELRRAIDQGASEQTLKELSLAPADTLYGEALRLVSEGKTSLEETLRVVGDAL